MNSSSYIGLTAGLAVALAVAAIAPIAPIAPPARADTPDTANAPPARAPVFLVAAVPGAGDAVTLIGPSGQRYASAAPGEWRRAGAGGVAATVTAARRGRDGVLIAAGDDSPLYVFESDAWHVQPLPARGRVSLPATGALALVAGRAVFTARESAPRSRRWVRLGSAPAGPVTAVWSPRPNSVYVAVKSGMLVRIQAGGGSRVSLLLPAGDAVTALVGAPGKVPVAVSQTGVIAKISGTRAARIAVPATVRPFAFHAGGASPSGAVWLAGAIARADGASVPDPAAAADVPGPAAAAPRAALIQIVGRTATAVPVPALAPGDRFRVVHVGAAGDLVVATARGAVWRRDTAGAWQAGVVHGDVEPTSTHTSAGARPARTH